MKSYTDLEQSKKLAEILPIESADMCFNISQWHNNMPPLMTPYSRFNEFFNMETPAFLIPCWSLETLLNVLPTYIEKDGHTTFLDIYKTKNLGWVIEYSDNKDDFVEYVFDSQFLIDACYKMILKLNKVNLL